MGRPRDLRRRYGMEPTDYRRLFDSQNGVCAICGREPLAHRMLSVDHDHETGAIRGLLCDRCNLVLGQLNDSRALLQSAIDYLETHDMSKWTDAELEALRLSQTYHEWGEMTGYTHSYDSWETKRRRLPPADAASPETVPVTVPLDIPGGGQVEVRVVVTLGGGKAG